MQFFLEQLLFPRAMWFSIVLVLNVVVVKGLLGLTSTEKADSACDGGFWVDAIGAC